jgi:hypothetical protein
MSSMIGKWNGIFFLAVTSTAVTSTLGCKLGVPIDRNVQISRHFADENPADEPPQTRLVHSGSVAQTSKNPQSSQAVKSVSDGPVIESLSDLPADDWPDSRPMISKAEKPPVGDLAPHGATDDETSIDAGMMLAAGLENADLTELLAAFRESPPHIQQQAIRQLIAAASLRATSTQQPGGIDQQLKNALGALPKLPEEIEDSGIAPTRLAATGQSPSPNQVQSEAPDAAVSQAVASTGETGSEVAVTAATSTAATDSIRLADQTQTPTAISNLLDPSATQPSQPTAAVRDQSTLFAELLETLQTPMPGESDGDRFRRDVIRRHLLVLSGDPDTAVDAMKGLTPSEQEFLRHHLLAIWQMTNPEGHPVASRRLSSALPKIQTANQHLRQANEQLDLRSLAFCTEIVSYGQVKRFQTSRFDGGQKVILYCEIDNFVAEKTSDGYETELQGSYEVFDSSGTKVAGLVLPADRQVCDHYLRDYFIAYQMNLPTDLPPGAYRLELTMECVKGKKFGQASIPMTIK